MTRSDVQMITQLVSKWFPALPTKHPREEREHKTENRQWIYERKRLKPRGPKHKTHVQRCVRFFFFLYSVRRCPKRNSHTGCDIKRVLLEDQSPWNPLKMETRSSVLSRNWSLDLSDGGNSLYLHRVRTALENPWKQSYWKAFELLNDNICEISVSKKQSFHSKWTLQPVW